MDIINEIHYCHNCGFSHNFTHGKSPEAIRLDLEDGKDA